MAAAGQQTVSLCFRDISTNERRSHSVNDSRPSTDEYAKGMKAAGSVMKAAVSAMKVRMYLSASYLMREWPLTGAVANVTRGGRAQAQTDLDELFYIAE